MVAWHGMVFGGMGVPAHASVVGWIGRGFVPGPRLCGRRVCARVGGAEEALLPGHGMARYPAHPVAIKSVLHSTLRCRACAAAE